MVLRRGSWLVDAAVVVICLVVDVGVLPGRFDDAAGAGWEVATAYVAAVAGPVALAWRRRFPVPVLAAVLVTGAMMWVAAVPPVGHGPAVLFAVYAVAAGRPRPTALAWFAVTVAAVAVHQRATWWVDGVSFTGNLVLLAGAWWLGDQARRRREESQRHRQRADELAAARDELARHAVAEERLRIARELHDVVAHTMSAVAVQSATGRVAFDREPEVARAALGEIEHLARDALGEMRRLLVVLRSDPDAPADDDRGPMASLGDLDRLVATARAAGVTVDVRVDGDGTPVPAGVDLAAFRIIQEALTNVTRHAGADRATVSVCYGREAVVIEVDDDGPGDAPPLAADGAASRAGAGMGIVGMRERAASCGGTVAASPKPAGGFRVVATLPVGAGAVTR